MTEPTSTGPTSTPDGTYAPERDGEPDPGEVVWAWVPYEDDPSQGKDRPVLVIGTETAADGQEMVRCLVMTSKDHDRDAAQEASVGRYWMDVGSGAWDPRGRPSEVRLNRLLVIPAATVRREGAALAPEVYAAVIEARRPFVS
ncbi:PemK-like, MazF-like toxin of type II toxin-antitoxin system [Nocardioides sp. J9]|uniref:type II toxin-antitoxin system PemK/MazF family toxin n=1 Tax=Nocardioides sp. J9 TaxID=935844 RepID=UPI0011AA70E8|nr:type II toxin-antitoxin system PemK/MazF family toxin [Nocardioides sp. J9]TWH04983.1 PemK-like, MazF-like toxin of type II toxin-antitoxin system [Nocardioides sp. J9]